ncbi:MAG: SLC13 family permease, partial [Candidatus Omnitrophota bacterium]
MRLEVDTRPLPVVLFSRTARTLIFLALAGLFVWILKAPLPAGLSPEGQKAIAAFAVCLVLWVTHVIPLMITSLLAIILLPLLGIVETKQAYALFGNYAVFFILGAFILTAAMMKSGLSSRISLWVLQKMGQTPRRLLLGIFLSGVVFSFFMSEHAVAAMMFPIILEIARGLELKPFRSRYGASLFLAMAWGTVVGGVATLLGGARAPLALGILHELTGERIGFFQWTWAVFPVVLVLGSISYALIRWLFPIEIASTQKAQEILTEKIRGLGRMSGQEKGIGLIMIATILAWMFLGERFGLANIAIASVVVMFIVRLVRWRDVEEYVNWGIILMYGGAIALGYA